MDKTSAITLLWFIFPLMSTVCSLSTSIAPDVEALITGRGYSLETYEIETKDGYLLTYHRIPHGRAMQYATGDLKTGPPVLLQHGLMSSSAVWLLSEQSLGFAFADAGYDVWLGNARGNSYSRKHKEMDPDNNETFWRFSFHEMGLYDLPAAIDFILHETGRPQLLYVGHSMGTTMFFVLGAVLPRYMAKVEAMVALAPVAFPRHISSPVIKLVKASTHILIGLFKAFRQYEVFPYSRETTWANEHICSVPHFSFICQNAFGLLDGFKGEHINRIPLETILEYVPAGSSFRTIRHYRQIMKKGKTFRMYDYGKIKNWVKYGSFDSPSYNLSHVTAPMYVYYGNNDWVATPEDVLFAVNFFPNVKKVTMVPHDDYSHLDFMWNTDKHLVYDDVISTLNKIVVEDKEH